MPNNINIDNLIKNEFDPCKKDILIPEFEEKLKSFFNVKNVIAVSSGTAAIHLGLAAAEIKKGDEVLVPSCAVIMSIMPVLYQGAIPIFVDCSSNSIDFDYDDLESKITERTKAIIPVYLWGCSYNIDKLKKIAKKYGLTIIEDACQAFGSKWKEEYLGTIGDVGCFSLKNGKILATGEGGFIISNNDTLAERCRLLRNHCTNIKDPKKSFTEMGWNYRITELQAWLGIYNLERIKQKIELRKKQTQYIYKGLCDIEGIKIYNYKKDEKSNYFSPVLICDDGINVAQKISKNGVINSTGTFGLIPANERKVFIDYCNENNYKIGYTYNCKKLLNKVVALSVMEDMDENKMNFSIKSIKNTRRSNDDI